MSSDTIHSQFDENRVFKNSLKYSAGLHIFILLFFTIKAFLIPDDAINYSSAVRVDIVALPDKLDPSQIELTKPEEKAEPKKVAKEEKTQEVKKEPDTIAIKKTKTKQQEALDRLKKMSAIDRIKNEVSSSQKKSNALEKISQVKGNVLAAGTSLSGLNQLQHDQYVATLDQHIKNNWTLPEWMAKKKLKARVRLKIDKSGLILSRDLIVSSGDSEYDDMVLDTIDRSAPYPRPPEKFIDIAAVRGILIGFPE
jgi:colicin import membrane protein